MAEYIIYKDGAYNFFTTIADGACYEEALTLEQVHEVIKEEYGQEGLRKLPERLKRAQATGCSGHDWTLEDCIESNRAGPGERKMPRDEFIHRYLTFKPNVET